MFSFTQIISSSRSHRSSRLYAVAFTSIRSKSTTSAIKAGLRAESSRTTSARFAARPSRFGGFESRSRTPTSRSRYQDDRSYDRGIGERSRRRPGSSQQRSSPRYRDDDLGKSSSASRTALPPNDSNGLPLSRRERRAAFWEQKQSELEEGEDVESTEDTSSRPYANQQDQDRRRQRSSRYGSDTDVRGRSSSEEISSGRRERQSFTSRSHRRLADQADEHIPSPIQYTTAASQFLYGANVVIAALSAQRRKIYHLYMHKRAEADNIAQIRRTATARGISITRTTDNDLLERMSEGRPHNGVVLETSPLPARPAISLGRFKPGSKHVNIVLAPQSAENARVNGTDTLLPIPKHRAPVVVFLDGITDPGNVGSILRSAHFFGIDSVAIATQTCAPLSSAVLAKASSGACEAVPILQVAKAGAFVKGCADQGWTICAAVAPEDQGRSETSSDESTGEHGGEDSGDAPGDKTQTSMDTTRMLREDLLADKPRLLLLGAEGEGLRAYFKRRADVLLTIPGGGSATAAAGVNDVGVDSMNVGVAAGILMHALTAVEAKKPANELGFGTDS